MAIPSEVFDSFITAADAKALAAAMDAAKAVREDEIRKNVNAAKNFVAAFTEGRVGRSIADIVSEVMGGDEPPVERDEEK